MTRIILHGCAGAMGQAVLKAACEQGIDIAAGIDAADISGTFPVFSSIADCDIKADAIVDFSVADAVGLMLRFAAKNRIPAVVCTTGLSSAQENEVIAAARFTPVFRSANMSLGISVVTSVLRQISGLLYDSGFDVEILEKHHNRKIDAPSGTAKLLGDTVNAALDGRLEPIYDRSPHRERRQRTELGFSSVRGGTLTGEHTVIFAGKDEVIELKHTAFSREIYAVGALKAAEFIKDKPPGLYTMENLVDAAGEAL